MTRTPIDDRHWQQQLEVLATRHGTPGAVLGILRLDPAGQGERVLVAHGVLNRGTGVAVTGDSVFQIGSIGKVWTTTLAMQLLDEGLITLDAPIVDVLPELRLSDPEVTRQVTLRHLLTHTSGIDGDVFSDTGRGDDCLEKYVEQLRDVAQIHPLGATWSYCNAGFSLLGRVVERLTGGTWDEAIQERIVRPLGLRRTVTLPEDALLHRTAVGHIEDESEETVPTPVWMLPRSLGPAGLVSCTVDDLLTFADCHLAGGVAADGTRVLSRASATAMTAHQIDLPDPHTLGSSWGLGWIRFDWDGHEVYGHDGSTIGQSAFLRILPEAGLAVVLVANGGQTRDLFRDLFTEVFADLAGLTVPAPLSPPAATPEVDAQRHVGVYERAGMRLEVGEDRTLRMTPTAELADLPSEKPLELAMHPVNASGDLFVVRLPGAEGWTPVTFYALPEGQEYVHLGARATPKTA